MFSNKIKVRLTSSKLQVFVTATSGSTTQSLHQVLNNPVLFVLPSHYWL